MATKGRRPHQRRALALIQVLEGDDALQPELGVPQADWSIDAVVRIGAVASDGWGVVRDHVRDRDVLVEHYHRTPNIGALARAHAKHALLVERWHTTPTLRAGSRPPALLVLCGGRPRRVLAGVPRLRAHEPSGLWLAPGADLGDLVVLDLVHLARNVPGTSVLRLMRGTRDARELARKMNALQRDPTVLASTRAHLVDAMMEGRVPMERQENERLAEFLVRQGIEQGIEQGRALAIIDLLELRGVTLDEPSRARILACHDADTLRRWLVSASTALRIDEVFDRA